MKYKGSALEHLKKIISKVFWRGRLSKLAVYTEAEALVKAQIWNNTAPDHSVKLRLLRHRTAVGLYTVLRNLDFILKIMRCHLCVILRNNICSLVIFSSCSVISEKNDFSEGEEVPSGRKEIRLLEYWPEMIKTWSKAVLVRLKEKSQIQNLRKYYLKNRANNTMIYLLFRER